jgi:hypothetical protein
MRDNRLFDSSIDCHVSAYSEPQQCFDALLAKLIQATRHVQDIGGSRCSDTNSSVELRAKCLRHEYGGESRHESHCPPAITMAI